TSQVDTLAQALRKEVRLEPGSDGVPGEPGQHATVQLQRALAALPIVRNSGVAVVEGDPPTILVSVDDIVTLDCPVRVEVPAAQLLDGPPEINPTSVKLRAPASIKLPPDLQLVARLGDQDLSNLPEGRRVTLPAVPVELPEALRGLDSSLARVTPR